MLRSVGDRYAPLVTTRFTNADRAYLAPINSEDAERGENQVASIPNKANVALQAWIGWLLGL